LEPTTERDRVRDLERALGAFGSRLDRRRLPLCRELELWLLADGVDLEAACDGLADGEAPPFWAFCWGSGQALARHLLDHPEIVRDKRVVDFGAGSGIAGIAAARAGAAHVLALDLDPQSRRAAELNALLNNVEIESSGDLPRTWDVMLAADVLYETGLREWLLTTAISRGPVLLADPGRAGTPRIKEPGFARIRATTFPDVDSPQTEVALYWLR